MAEPTSPEEEPTVDRKRADRRADLLQPPTEEELAATGEPTADEIHAAAATGAPAETEASTAAEADMAPASGEPAATPESKTAAQPASETQAARTVAAAPSATPEGETAVLPAAETTADTTVLPAADTAVIASSAPEPARTPAPSAPPAPPQPQPVIAPAEEVAPPPIAKGNRLVGTLWVLLAAGLFQVVFFGVNALVALSFGGASAALPQVQHIAQTSLAWLPVVLFFLLFELVVLLFNRAGRFAYVVASLVIGLVVYAATVLLYSLIVLHTVGDANTLAQTFLNWEFILVGLVAREVMLWTGIAIGSRGIRVRNRNREARAKYDQELADARA